MASLPSLSHECAHCGHITLGIEIPPSPVPHLIHTNIAPSESEKLLIRSTISNSLSKIAQFDTQRKSILRELRRQRRVLNRYHHIHQRLLSQEKHIPPEILAQIFILCLPAHWQDRFVEPRAMQISLSHVSRYWRCIVLSTPQLWSHMNIKIRYDQPLKTSIDMAETWFIRSGCALLSLRVVVDDKAFEIQPILDLIMSHSRRWQHLELELPEGSDLAPVRHNLPCLESLLYGSTRIPLSSTRKETAFEFAPHLQKILLGPEINSNLLSAPWHQLTECHTNVISAQDGITILLNCPNLVACTLDIYSSVFESTNNLIHLPYLRSLHLDTENKPADFLDVLVLPSLVEFQLTEYLEDWHWYDKFKILISRSCCLLESFDIQVGHSPSQTEEFTGCLQAMSSLKYLALHFIAPEPRSSSNHILHSLTRKDEGPSLLPHLTHLTMDLTDAKFQLHLLKSMIRSRWYTTPISDKLNLPHEASACLDTVILIGATEHLNRHGRNANFTDVGLGGAWTKTPDDRWILQRSQLTQYPFTPHHGNDR